MERKGYPWDDLHTTCRAIKDDRDAKGDGESMRKVMMMMTSEENKKEANRMLMRIIRLINIIIIMKKNTDRE